MHLFRYQSNKDSLNQNILNSIPLRIKWVPIRMWNCDQVYFLVALRIYAVWFFSDLSGPIIHMLPLWQSISFSFSYNGVALQEAMWHPKHLFQNIFFPWIFYTWVEVLQDEKDIRQWTFLKFCHFTRLTSLQARLAVFTLNYNTLSVWLTYANFYMQISRSCFKYIFLRPASDKGMFYIV